jgi:hypothetical protein
MHTVTLLLLLLQQAMVEKFHEIELLPKQHHTLKGLRGSTLHK